MTKDELIEEYYDWMIARVNDRRHFPSRYVNLLDQLYLTEFIPTMSMDMNRADDGIDLRYRFGYDAGYNKPMIAAYLDDQPCSILEMMVALAIRCEEHIMSDPDFGDRTGIWFWSMIKSLGLETMEDDYYDSSIVSNILVKFMLREYCIDGRGGLFTVSDHYRRSSDMTDVEIWCQMCWFLEEYNDAHFRRDR